MRWYYWMSSVSSLVGAVDLFFGSFSKARKLEDFQLGLQRVDVTSEWDSSAFEFFFLPLELALAHNLAIKPQKQACTARGGSRPPSD